MTSLAQNLYNKGSNALKQGKQRIYGDNEPAQESMRVTHGSRGPCPWLCNMVPSNLPPPGPAQSVLHPRKDVFVLKVAKVSPEGIRRSKMELELVTPKGPEKKPLCRIDTRETQCEPDPPPCTCCGARQKKKRKNKH